MSEATQAATNPIFLQFGVYRKLVPSAVDTVLKSLTQPNRRSGCVWTETGAWTDEARARGILINLSEIEWCDLMACAQIPMIIERALKDSLPHVGLALPDAAPTPREEAQEDQWKRYSNTATRITELRAAQERREKARVFLDAFGFTEVCRCSHLSEAPGHGLMVYFNARSLPSARQEEKEVPADSQATADATDDPEARAEAEERGRFVTELHDRARGKLHPYIFFQWVRTDVDSCSLQAEMERLKSELLAVLTTQHEGRLGLMEFDAETIVNIVFHELLENVQEHALQKGQTGASHCLVAAWARRSGHPTLATEYLLCERPFFRDWVQRHDLPLVELALGDSGLGVQDTVRKEFQKQPIPLEGVPERDGESLNEEQKMLFWALARWSSSRKSTYTASATMGTTRGLFRVERLARAYQGALCIRSGRSLAGWDHGGRDIPRAMAASVAGPVMGTLVQMKFVTRTQQMRGLPLPALAPTDVEFMLGPPLDLAEAIGTNGALTAQMTQHLKRLKEALAHRDPSGPAHRCVIALVSRLPKKQPDRAKVFSLLFDHLRVLSTPGALVLCVFGMHPVDLSIEVAAWADWLSRNEDQRWPQAAPNAHRPSNVFWVLDRDLCIHWAGVCSWELPILRKLLPENVQQWEPVRNAEFLESEEQVRRAIGDYRQHRDWFQLDPSGGVKPRFTPRDVAEHILKAASSRILDLVTNDPRGRTWGLVENKKFLSPNLQVTNRWIHIPEVAKRLDVLQTLPSDLSKLAEPRHGFNPAITAVTGQGLRGRLARDGRDEYLTADEVAARGFGKPNMFSEGRNKELLEKVLHLLSQPMGPTLAAHALALAVRFALQPAATSDSEKSPPAFAPRYVLPEPFSMKEIASGLHHFLGLQRRPIDLPVRSPLRDAEDVWEIIKGHQVLIYTDVIVSGSGVQRIIGQVTKENATPVVIACFLDLRPRGQHGKPVEDGGMRIPVVSLAGLEDVVIESEPAEYDLAWIAQPPFAREPSFPETPRPRPQQLPQEECQRLIRGAKALRFGHFVLGSERHFTFLVDPVKLLRHTPSKEATRREVERIWRQFQRREPTVSGVPLILVESPAFDVDLGREIFRGVDCFGSAPRVETIRRDTLTGMLRRMPEPVAGQPVLMLLWSSISGSSAQLFVRQLAQAGASAVCCVVWLSRMQAQMQEVLHSWHGIEVVQPPISQSVLPLDEIGTRQQQPELSPDHFKRVPVAIRFLTSAALPAYGSHDCPVCRQRELMREDTRRLFTGGLHQFVEEYVAATRPTEVNMLPVDDEDSALPLWNQLPEELPPLMLEWRADLDKAQGSTVARLEVKSRIRRLREVFGNQSAGKEELAQAQALLCLLATENGWLKEPPLSFATSRKDIAEIASVAAELLSHSAPEIVVRMAVLALRAADKITFAQKLPSLYQACAHHTGVLEQLLYDIFTYLDQEHHHRSYYLDPMFSSLNRLLKAHRSHAETPATAALETTLRALLNRTTDLQNRDLEKASPAYLWNQLRKFYGEHVTSYHKEFTLCAKNFNSLPPAVRDESGAEVLGSVNDWQEVRLRWRRAKDLLQQQVLPILRRLIRLVQEAPFAESFLGGKGSEQFQFFQELVIQPYNSHYIRDMDSSLHSFCRRPPPPSEAAAGKLRETARLFAVTFLNREDHDGNGCAVWNLLKGGPVNITQALHGIQQMTRIWCPRYPEAIPSFSYVGKYEAEVFCHGLVIQDLVIEVVRNAFERHLRPDLPEGEEPYVHLLLTERSRASGGKDEGRDTCLVCSNRGSMSSLAPGQQPGGKGLKQLQDNLRAFGGDLLWKEDELPLPLPTTELHDAEGPWDFQVIAFFRKSNEGGKW